MAARLLKRAAGVNVVYARKAGGPTINLEVWFGTTEISLDRPGAIRTQMEFGTRTVRAVAAELVQSGSAFMPAVGDRMTVTINGTSELYEVRNTDNGPAWDWSDTERDMIRIHTKRVST